MKIEDSKKYEFNYLIKNQRELPASITDLTGITKEMIDKDGLPIDRVLRELLEFVGDKDIVGYNVDFDVRFINSELEKNNLPLLKNKRYDLIKYVKKEKQFLSNYKLQTVLSGYGIDEKVPHRALYDARLIYELSKKVNKFLQAIERE